MLVNAGLLARRLGSCQKASREHSNLVGFCTQRGKSMAHSRMTIEQRSPVRGVLRLAFMLAPLGVLGCSGGSETDVNTAVAQQALVLENAQQAPVVDEVNCGLTLET